MRIFIFNSIHRRSKNKFVSKCGQATAELAVMGVLMLVLFGTLLRYGQIMDAQEQMKMYTHRKALELAKIRKDSGKYGQATVVAMREVFPVNMFSSERDPNYVSASASVSIHDGTDYYDDGDGKFDRTEPEHVGATYYQIGAEMINNNKFLVMPYMLVKREANNPDNAVTSAVDAQAEAFRDMVFFGPDSPDPEDYESLEPAPVENTSELVRAVLANKYSRVEVPLESTYEEKTTSGSIGTTTFQFMDEEAIKEMDEDILEVIKMPEENVVIEHIQAVEQQRQWNTQR